MRRPLETNWQRGGPITLASDTWYIGALVTAGIPELLFADRETEFIAHDLYPSFGAIPH